MTSLSDRLKSLGVKIGAQDLPKPDRQRHIPIEEVVDGKELETPFGQTFVVTSTYPAHHRQGQVDLSLKATLEPIAAWAGDPRLANLDPEAFVFLDTETSGLAGGTGTYAFLIGVGRLSQGGFRLAQFFMRDPIEEPAQLAGLIGFLGDYQGLVTFNGKSFDVPLLNTRFITNSEISPLNAAAHLDLLPLARRLWRDRLPSRALGFLEEHILGAKRTQEDVPGWLIPTLYFDYLRDGDARPLKNVFYHNAMDILSLAALLNHVSTVLADPLGCGLEHATDLIAIARLFEDLGKTEMAAQLYKHGLDQELPAEISAATARRWSIMEKRRENLPAALEMWRHAAEQGEIYAHEELAKYFEHRERDYTQAIYWTKQALNLVESPGFSRLEHQHLYIELKHRLARLERKQKNSGSSEDAD